MEWLEWCEELCNIHYFYYHWKLLLWNPSISTSPSDFYQNDYIALILYLLSNWWKLHWLTVGNPYSKSDLVSSDRIIYLDHFRVEMIHYLSKEKKRQNICICYCKGHFPLKNTGIYAGPETHPVSWALNPTRQKTTELPPSGCHYQLCESGSINGRKRRRTFQTSWWSYTEIYSGQTLTKITWDFLTCFDFSSVKNHTFYMN